MSNSLLDPTIIVGIGASAGGIEALQELIKNLPTSDKLAYIIAQHLSPTTKSMMVECLSPSSALEVIEADDGMKVEPSKIYITPPNKNIFVTNDTIQLKAPPKDFIGSKPSIDLFFASLAQDKRHEAIGVILSGTGADGTKGCAKIKVEGGITIAQEPKDAKYPAMPSSAIHARQIDIVALASKIGWELGEIEKYISGEIGLEHITTRPKDNLEQIFRMLQDAHGSDFSGYKLTTLNRRIRRRMSALKIAQLSDYVDVLKKDALELATLRKDFLIGVTAFFRDKESFDQLTVELAKILENNNTPTLKIWDAACSSGEETYSIAIMVAQIIEEKGLQKDVKIFATDIDEESIRTARHGIYSAADVVDIPKELLGKYFTIKNETYKINKNIRDMVIFSCHDIISDPPFTKLDMIVCRNLLIYFNSSLQKRILPMFHYALKSGGILFLGRSETIGTHHNLFTPIEKESKLYSREFNVAHALTKNIKSYHTNINIKEQNQSIPPEEQKSLSDSLLESLGGYFLPLSIIINKGMDIVFIKERNPYILYSGEVTTNVFRSVHEALALELRSLIHKCIKEDAPQTGMFREIELFKDMTKIVRMVVLPLRYHEIEKLYIISFQEELEKNIGVLVDDKTAKKRISGSGLQAELTNTKMHLQAVVEELDLSNEELQSLNEEMQSTNEELKSTNEEFETTNEELEGTNEELRTAYSELRATSDEIEEQQKKLEKLNDNLKIAISTAQTNEMIANNERAYSEGLIEASNALVVVLDAKGKITRFNKQLETMTGYSKADVIGKEWSSIFVAPEQSSEWLRSFRDMLLTPEVDIWKYEFYLPLKNTDRRTIAWQYSLHTNPDGNSNILAFGIDITERNLALQHIKLQDEYLKAIINAQNTIIIIIEDNKLLDANRAFFLFFEKFNTIEAFNQKHKSLCEYFEKKEESDFVYDCKDGKTWLERLATPGPHRAVIKKNGEKHYFILRLADFGNAMDNRKFVSMSDVTELENHRKYLESKIIEESKHSKMQEQIMIQQAKMAAMGEMLGAIAHQWRQPLNTLGIIVQDVAQIYSLDDLDEAYVAKFKESSMRLIQHMSKTIDDFRNFFRPTSDNESFLVQDSLNESFEIFSALLKNNEIAVENSATDDGSDRLMCNKNQLKQVFLNIISNAKDAILEGLEHEIIQSGVIQTNITADEQNVRVSIWNNGSHISKSVQNKIFEPYFTTKEHGKGTGIGLYISKVIIEQNLKGKISIHNKKEGVEVIIVLPRK